MRASMVECVCLCVYGEGCPRWRYREKSILRVISVVTHAFTLAALVTVFVASSTNMHEDNDSDESTPEREVKHLSITHTDGSNAEVEVQQHQRVKPLRQSATNEQRSQQGFRHLW